MPPQVQQVLEEHYSTNPYPSANDFIFLSDNVNFEVHRIKVTSFTCVPLTENYLTHSDFPRTGSIIGAELIRGTATCADLVAISKLQSPMKAIQWIHANSGRANSTGKRTMKRAKMATTVSRPPMPTHQSNQWCHQQLCITLQRWQTLEITRSLFRPIRFLVMSTCRHCYDLWTPGNERAKKVCLSTRISRCEFVYTS